MNKRYYLFLYLIEVLLVCAAAWVETSPGYMDADYYYAGAQLLASGQGASEPYLWNYLNEPENLPVLSFSYWMPLTSLVTTIGIWLFPWAGWWGARLPILLLAGWIAPLTAYLAWRLTGNERQTRLAGLFALFPGFYLAYLPTTDVFTLEMVLGGLFALFVSSGGSEDRLSTSLRNLQAICKWLGVGILVGLLHLARADGLLWGAGALFALYMGYRKSRQRRLLYLLLWGTVLGVGYLLVMSPWLARNLSEWGSLFPPGGSKSFWLSEYEQTMLFPADGVNFQAWLEAGFGVHLRARLAALSGLLQTALAVQGTVILLPFMVAGLWRLRRHSEVRIIALMWGLLSAVMLVLFPFASVNGSYFHSAAALQPVLWAVAPVGIEMLGLRYAAWRKMPQPYDLVQFTGGVLLIACLGLSIFLYYQRVIGDDLKNPRWNASQEHYRLVETEILRLGAQTGDAVLVNNPPGYWLVSTRPALVIPYGDATMLLDVARQYQVRYLILEKTNPWQLANLYYHRVIPIELEYLTEVGTTQLFKVNTKSK